MIPVPELKLEICWWSCSFGVSILQRSSVDWDTSVALKLQFCSCSLDDFCSKCQKNQTVWVSSKAVYNSVGNMKFNWVPLPRECSHFCSPLPSFPLHMISRRPVSSVKPWLLCQYIIYVRYRLYMGKYNKFYWNSPLWSKSAINVLET